MRLAALAAALACAGCDGTGVMPAVSSSCTRIGSQCQLPGGPLGVCQQVDCAAGATPPCFTCVSQH